MYKVTYKVSDDEPLIFLKDLELISETKTHYNFYSIKSKRKFTISIDSVKTLIEV